jgi:hypothetical protein
VLRHEPRNSKIINPVSPAAIAASCTTLQPRRGRTPTDRTSA